MIKVCKLAIPIEQRRMKAIGIIPARYGSSRFPGKPLAKIGEKSMIRRVYEKVRLSGIKDVWIATDDKRIFNHTKEFGAQAIMTSVRHQSGTERCAEALKKIGGNFDVVVNIQGDEPFADPSHLKLLVNAFKNKDVQIATLTDAFDNLQQLFSPNTVKIIADHQFFATYFSRSVIPFLRDIPEKEWINHYPYLRHIGIYAFRTDVLQKVVKLKPSPPEKAESLEQLRWIYYGYKIKLIQVKYYGLSVDTPEDLEKANELLNNIYY